MSLSVFKVKSQGTDVGRAETYTIEILLINVTLLNDAADLLLDIRVVAVHGMISYL